jgi:hypothetical protein
MANPTATARGTPAGIRLRNGFPTKVTLGANPTVSFWEQTVKPSGRDNGDPIDTSTMFSTRKTKSPRALSEDTPVTGKAAYDPNVFTQIDSLIGVETTITVTFPDGSTDAKYGYLKSFVPNECQDGEMPTADYEMVITSWDQSAHADASHTLTSVAGT